MKRVVEMVFRKKLHSLDERTLRAVERTGERPQCDCLTSQHAKPGKWKELKLHNDRPREDCPVWSKLLDLIDQAARDGRKVFEPGTEFTWDEWTRITTLPASIGKLKDVQSLLLYGSNLVSIPPAIGEMTSLTNLDLYTSYRLHWLPFEVTKCEKLIDSRVSTRALYGNYKHRPPFPRLRPYVHGFEPDTCSVCDQPFAKFENHRPQQLWISLRVGTDVLPLLVHACSSECIDRLPKPPDGYISKPHKGGIGQAQPPAAYSIATYGCSA